MPFFSSNPVDELNTIKGIQLPPPPPDLNELYIDDAEFYQKKYNPIISIKDYTGFDKKKVLKSNELYLGLIKGADESIIVDIVRVVNDKLSYYMAIETGLDGKGTHQIVPVSIKKRSEDKEIDEIEKEMRLIKEIKLYTMIYCKYIASDRDIIVKKVIKKYNIDKLSINNLNINSRITRYDAYCKDCSEISSIKDALRAVRLCIFESKMYICVCISSKNGDLGGVSYNLYLYEIDGTFKEKYSFQYKAAPLIREEETDFYDNIFEGHGDPDQIIVNKITFYDILKATSTSGGNHRGKKKRQSVINSKSKSRRRYRHKSTKKHRNGLKFIYCFKKKHIFSIIIIRSARLQLLLIVSKKN